MSQDYSSNSDVRLLAECIGKDNCIIFVGAGVSMVAGCPSWDDLEKKIREYAEFYEPCPTLRAFDICKKKLGTGLFHEKLHEIISEIKTPSSIHEILARLPISVFVTTNYDNLLEKAIKQERGEDNVKIILKNSSILNQIPFNTNSKSLVIKIHGCIENIDNGLIVGELDYLTFIENNPFTIEFLSTLFKAKSILFIGYSFQDYHIIQLLLTIQKITKEYNMNKYFIGIDIIKEISDYYKSVYNLKVININKGINSIETTRNVLNCLNQILEKSSMPHWLKKALNHCEYNNIENHSIDAPIKNIFSSFDITCLVRLGLRLEKQLSKSLNTDIQIPLSKMIDSDLTFKKLIKIIEDTNPNFRSSIKEKIYDI